MDKEQLEILKNCKNEEEAIALIKSHNLELSEEDLKLVNGGNRFSELWKKIKEYQ